jgi:hypothetical protein
MKNDIPGLAQRDPFARLFFRSGKKILQSNKIPRPRLFVSVVYCEWLVEVKI